MNVRIPWLLAMLALGSGCATVGSASRAPEALPDPAVEGGEAQIVDLADASEVSLDEAVRRLAAHRHVYVGEHHGHPTSHRVQLEVLEALRSRGVAVAVGIEWLPAMVQMRLDAWLRGEFPEEALLETIAWKDHWGHRDEEYEPIFHWARRHSVPMVCLGAPTGLAHRLFRVGVDGLTSSERSQLPPLTSGNDAHRQFFDALMKRVAHGHFHGGSGSEKVMDRFYLAQLVRDETMAERVAEAVQGREEGVLVVLAGRGHVDHGLGIPLRAEAATKKPFLMVVPGESVEDAKELRAAGAIGGRLVGELFWIPAGPAR